LLRFADDAFETCLILGTFAEPLSPTASVTRPGPKGRHHAHKWRLISGVVCSWWQRKASSGAYHVQKLSYRYFPYPWLGWRLPCCRRSGLQDISALKSGRQSKSRCGEFKH